MSASRSGPRRRAPFTLVEMLVVITIIALLIALLLPSNKKARATARLVICQSNLGQISIAFVSYAAENQHMAPGYMEPYEVPSLTWVLNSDWPVPFGGSSPRGGTHYSYFHDQWMIGGNPKNDSNPNRFRPNVRKLNEYVMEAAKIFFCPSDIGAVNVDPPLPGDNIPVYEGDPGGGSAYIAGSSYPYNAAKGLYSGGRVVPWERIDLFPEPSKQVTLADDSMFYTWMDPTVYPLYSNFSARYFAGHPWHDPPENHPGAPGFGNDRGVLIYDQKANSAFADGHAATITFRRKLVTEDYVMWE